MFFNDEKFKVFYLPKNSKKASCKWNDDEFWKNYKGLKIDNHYNHALHLERSKLICIDIDPRNFTESSKRFLSSIQDILDTTYSHATASGGRHYIFSVESFGNIKVKKEIDKGIDIKYNGYIVIPPSTFEDKEYIEDSDKEIIELPFSLFPYVKKSDVEDDTKTYPDEDYTKKFDYKRLIRDFKESLQETFSYDDWIAFGMCLHNIFGGNKEGLNLFKNLSKNKLYPKGDLEAVEKWETFKSDENINRYKLRKLIEILAEHEMDIDAYISKDYVIPSLENVEEDKDIQELISKLNGISLNPSTEEKIVKLAYSYFKDTIFYLSKQKAFAQVLHKGTNKEDFIIFNNATELRMAFQYLQFKPFKSTIRYLIDYYISNPERSTYSEIEFAPYPTYEGCLNIFPKGAISKHPEGVDYNKEKIQPFLDFVRANLCIDETKGDDQFKYIMWWIAHLLRRPQESQSVVLVLWGKQGTGKNVFSSTIGRCFCSSKFYTGLRKSDIVGGYNDFLSGTFLVVCDEISENLSTENWSIIKSITASDRVRINPKFGKVFSAIVRTRFIFTSNHDPLWGRSSDNRRILKFETQKNFTDFGTLIKLREDPEFINELCKYFNSIDLSEFEPSVIPKDKVMPDEEIEIEKSTGRELTFSTATVLSVCKELLSVDEANFIGKIKSKVINKWLNYVDGDLFYDSVCRKYIEKYGDRYSNPNLISKYTLFKALRTAYETKFETFTITKDRAVKRVYPLDKFRNSLKSNIVNNTIDAIIKAKE